MHLHETPPEPDLDADPVEEEQKPKASKKVARMQDWVNDLRNKLGRQGNVLDTVEEIYTTEPSIPYFSWASFVCNELKG